MTPTDTLVSGTVNYDILLLGNSRINFGLNPYYFDSILNAKTYNFSLGGMNAEHFLTIGRLYLSRRTAPKIVCIGLDEYSYMDRYPGRTLYPYLLYADNKYINHYLTKNGFPMQAIRYFPFVKYAYMDEYYRNSIFTKERPIPRFRNNIYSGFLNIHENKNLAGVKYSSEEETTNISYRSTEWMEQLLRTYASKQTKVVFIYPPQLNENGVSQKKFLDILDAELAKLKSKYSFSVLNCREIIPRNYFVDEIHLNEPGTQIFSKYVANYLKDNAY